MLNIKEIELLTSLGLSLRQAKVYSVLCNFERLDVKLISKYTGIARQEIYRVIRSLTELGLIESAISSPQTFRSIDLDKGISFLLSQKKRNLNLLESKARKIAKESPSNKQKFLSEKPEFVLVPPKEAIIDKIKQLINNSQNSIDIISSWKRLSRYTMFSDTIEEACSRGVKTRFICEGPQKGKAFESFMKFCRKVKLCAVRFIDSVPNSIVGIYDDKECLLITNPDAAISQSSALWSNNPSILNVLRDYFQCTFNECKCRFNHQNKGK